MSDEELTKLKEQLKQEILDDLKDNKQIIHKINYWLPIGKRLENELKQIDKLKNMRIYPIYTAITTIVAKSLELKRILDLRAEQVEDANKRIDEILNIIKG